MLGMSTNPSLCHLRIHSETTEFFYAAHLCHSFFPTQERAELEAAKEELRQREAQQEFASVMDHGARVRKCAHLCYYLIFYALFFQILRGAGPVMSGWQERRARELREEVERAQRAQQETAELRILA